MSVWQSFARISGVAFQVLAAVGLGILLGYLADRLVPALGSVGVLAGSVLGFGAAIYLMVTGMKAYVASEDTGADRPDDREEQ
jgi:F0F1-type ATP synthase assembly protein I